MRGRKIEKKGKIGKNLIKLKKVGKNLIKLKKKVEKLEIKIEKSGQNRDTSNRSIGKIKFE